MLEPGDEFVRARGNWLGYYSSRIFIQVRKDRNKGTYPAVGHSKWAREAVASVSLAVMFGAVPRGLNRRFFVPTDRCSTACGGILFEASTP